jgi:AraC-like DNA-binding protein
MQPVSRSLLLLHPDAKLRARVRQAAGKHFLVEVVESWEALQQTLQSASLTVLVVVDPYLDHRGRPELAPELRALLRAFPGTTVVAAVDRHARFSEVRLLGEWGVAEVLSAEHADAATLALQLQAVRGRPLQSVLERALTEKASGRTREVLSAAAEVAAAGGQAEDLARALFLSMRTLHRRCEAAGVPPPRQTLAWLRLLLAAELLEQPGRGIEDVASACGYASDSGLRRACYEFLQRSPSELRRAGAFATVAHAFRRALSVPRAATPASA